MTSTQTRGRGWFLQYFLICQRMDVNSATLNVPWWRLFQTLVKHLRLRAPLQLGGECCSNAVASINLHHIGVIVHMNTKMILAALALSLSLAACAKKEEAAAPAEAPAATEPAPAAEPAPADPAAAPADPAAAPTDSATATPPAGETPPPAQ